MRTLLTSAYIACTSNNNAHGLPCTFTACTSCNNPLSLASVLQCTALSTIVGNCLCHFNNANKCFLTNNVVQMFYPCKDAHYSMLYLNICCIVGKDEVIDLAIHLKGKGIMVNTREQWCQLLVLQQCLLSSERRSYLQEQPCQ